MRPAFIQYWKALDMTAAEGETTTIEDSALQQLDESLNGVITEFIGTAEFTGKAVSAIRSNPRCSEAAVVVSFHQSSHPALQSFHSLPSWHFAALQMPLPLLSYTIWRILSHLQEALCKEGFCTSVGTAKTKSRAQTWRFPACLDLCQNMSCTQCPCTAEPSAHVVTHNKPKR